MLEPLHRPIALFELAQLVGALPPSGNADLLAQPGEDRDELTQRIPQPVEVGGKARRSWAHGLR